MTLEGILIMLLIGGIAGWLATLLVPHWGYGLVFNIIIGVVGGFVGGWLLGKLGVSVGGGIISAIITGAIGAIVILLAGVLLQRIGLLPRRRLR